MTDDRHEPRPLDELGELLSLADRPVHFPEPDRSLLLEQVIDTASLPRGEGADIVRFVPDDRGPRRPVRALTIGVAASFVLIIVVAVALVAGPGERSDAPADQPLPVDLTVDEICDALPPLAAANGLGDRSVQIGDVSPGELDEVRRLLAQLSANDGGPVDAEQVDDAITRIRLLAVSIGASDTGTAASAMTAARASVRAVIDDAC